MSTGEVAHHTTAARRGSDPRSMAELPTFRQRGREVTRIEAFVDAAFAFAVTLLVVSLDVPQNFAAMTDALRGVPAFAACFLVVWQVWYAHYRFCRRYGLADFTTLALNALLVFIVLVYVYPLKFLALVAIEATTGLGPHHDQPLALRLPPDRIPDLFIIYGVGFAAVWAVMALLFGRALARRDELGLTPLEVCETLHSIYRFVGMAAVGVLSCMLAWVLTGQAVLLAGWCYALIAVVEFSLGWYFGRRREYAVRHMIATGRLSADEPP